MSTGLETKVRSIRNLNKEIRVWEEQIAEVEKQREELEELEEGTEELLLAAYRARYPQVYTVEMKFSGHGRFSNFRHTAGNYSTKRKAAAAVKQLPLSQQLENHHSEGAVVRCYSSANLSLKVFRSIDQPPQLFIAY